MFQYRINIKPYSDHKTLVPLSKTLFPTLKKKPQLHHQIQKSLIEMQNFRDSQTLTFQNITKLYTRTYTYTAKQTQQSRKGKLIRKTDLEDSESYELLELEGELVPELLLVQICKRIVPLRKLRMRAAQRFQVLQSGHSWWQRERKEREF